MSDTDLDDPPSPRGLTISTSSVGRPTVPLTMSTSALPTGSLTFRPAMSLSTGAPTRRTRPPAPPAGPSTAFTGPSTGPTPRSMLPPSPTPSGSSVFDEPKSLIKAALNSKLNAPIETIIDNEWLQVQEMFPNVGSLWKAYLYLMAFSELEKMRVKPTLSADDKAVISKRMDELQTKIMGLLDAGKDELEATIKKKEGGKPKKVNRKKKVKGGEAYDAGMIGNTADLYAYAMKPIDSATRNVPTLLSVGSPVTGSLNTDFVTSTRGVSNSVMQSITPNLGGAVYSSTGGAWGKAKKPKGKKM